MKLPPLPSLKDAPQNLWTRVLTITPVALTVIATVLAGLSSSEMNQAQYYRTLAAQVQSKAGDQWNFFQAKKLQALTMRNTLDLLQGTTEIGPIEPGQLGAVVEKLLKNTATDPSTAGADHDALVQKLQADIDALSAAPASAWALVKSQAVSGTAHTWHDPAVAAAVRAIAASAPAESINQAIAGVQDANLKDEIASASADAQAADRQLGPANAIADRIESAARAAAELAGHDKALGADLRQVINDFTAARLRYSAARYEAEARENQATAFLYEIQVRMDNAHAARRQQRSGRFFLGMLGAQAAVVVSSLSLGMRQRNLLWSFAAAVGLVAVSFSCYVYLFI